MTVTEQLSALVSEAFESAGYAGRFGAVTLSDRPELCQFQCNGAFAAAKEAHKAPLAIAREVAEKMTCRPPFAKAEAVSPGFLNLTLADEALAAMAGELGSGERELIPQTGAGRTVVLDYGGPNIAKPLHIGHLRPAIIGESIKRLAKAAGYRTVADVHLGDWGMPIGLVIALLRERHPDWACFAKTFDPSRDPVPSLSLELLQEAYPAASAKSREDPAFKKEAADTVVALQKGDAGVTALWREILRVSLPDLKELYGRLSVSFDLWYGESDAKPYIEPLLSILREKGLLTESDGALVVALAREDDTSPMPPVIVQKSDGSSLYATTDLATILQRERDFSPDAVWYVADKRQSLHFEQVFRCARAAELVPPETELRHLSFGTINGADGKPFKTRDGGVMPLAELLDTVADAAMEKLRDSEYLATLSERDKRAVAQKVGMAAVKFGDLVNHRSKDYVFDTEKFLSFEGKTGTYLLYTLTRIQSVLKKAPSGEGGTLRVYGDSERELLLSLLLAPEAFSRALAEQAPNLVCESAYRIASAFSKVYHDHRILSEPDAEKRGARLALCRLTREVLLAHLDILGIEPVENM